MGYSAAGGSDTVEDLAVVKKAGWATPPYPASKIRRPGKRSAAGDQMALT